MSHVTFNININIQHSTFNLSLSQVTLIVDLVVAVVSVVAW